MTHRVRTLAIAVLLIISASLLAIPRWVSADINETAVTDPQVLNAASITAGAEHTCALLATGAVKCWGLNGNGQLGDGSLNESLIPKDVTGLSSDVVSISAGTFHTCAVTRSGGAKCWGKNDKGQLGDDTLIDKSVPTDVNGLQNGVIAISAGKAHTCALLTSGGVKCWGENNVSGQIGDNTLVSKKTPTDVFGLTSGVTSISSGDNHTCALLNTGGVKCWGGGVYGQLGIDSQDNKNTPFDVIGLTSGVAAIAAGLSHTCALLTTGAVKCWGYNNRGQLGDNSTTLRKVAVDVQQMSSGVTSISTGGYHTCARLSTGAVKCWGWNNYGQLADSAVTDSSIAIDVEELGNSVLSVTTGGYHTCAILDTKSVSCWGFNNRGQLGDNSQGNKSIPTQVTGLTSGVGVTTTSTTPTEQGSATPTPDSSSGNSSATTVKTRPVVAADMSTLPETGSDTADLLIVALSLLAVGAVLTLRRRVIS